MDMYHVSLTAETATNYKRLYPSSKLNLLVSYASIGHKEFELLTKYRSLFDKIMIDSGTYTLDNNREKYSPSITLKGYMGYLAEVKDIDQLECFNFDEDYSANGFNINLDNQLEMESAGFKPIPVIHNCYNEEIDYYIDEGYKKIAIGSGELSGKLVPLQLVTEKIHNAGVQIHFLGKSDFKRLAYCPVSSCDSSTWIKESAKGGLVLYWNPSNPGYNKTERIRFRGFATGPNAKSHFTNYRYIRDFGDYLYEELGLSVRDLIGKQGLQNRALANLHFHVKIGHVIEQKHREQGFT